MLTLLRTATAASLITLYISVANAQSCAVALKTMVNVGCFSSGDPLVDQGSYTFQTAGYCQCVCATMNKPVMATSKGSDCYCGDLIPATTAEASNSSCNSPCNGYGLQDCGGNGFWTVALTGIDNSVGNVDGSSSNGASSTSPASTLTQTHSPSVITEAGQTIVVTASSQATGTAGADQSGGGTNKAGVAAGVVVGVIAIAAIAGGVFFFLRQRKRKAVEEEYRRNAAINSFVGGKGKSEASSTNDQRLDPSVMFNRRESIGSIADERDYSRRILAVCLLLPTEMLHRTLTCIRCGILTMCKNLLEDLFHCSGLEPYQRFGASTSTSQSAPTSLYRHRYPFSISSYHCHACRSQAFLCGVTAWSRYLLAHMLRHALGVKGYSGVERSVGPSISG